MQPCLYAGGVRLYDIEVLLYAGEVQLYGRGVWIYEAVDLVVDLGLGCY